MPTQIPLYIPTFLTLLNNEQLAQVASLQRRDLPRCDLPPPGQSEGLFSWKEKLYQEMKKRGLIVQGEIKWDLLPPINLLEIEESLPDYLKQPLLISSKYFQRLKLTVEELLDGWRRIGNSKFGILNNFYYLLQTDTGTTYDLFGLFSQAVGNGSSPCAIGLPVDGSSLEYSLVGEGHLKIASSFLLEPGKDLSKALKQLKKSFLDLMAKFLYSKNCQKKSIKTSSISDDEIVAPSIDWTAPGEGLTQLELLTVTALFNQCYKDLAKSADLEILTHEGDCPAVSLIVKKDGKPCFELICFIYSKEGDLPRVLKSAPFFELPFNGVSSNPQVDLMPTQELFGAAYRKLFYFFDPTGKAWYECGFNFQRGLRLGEAFCQPKQLRKNAGGEFAAFIRQENLQPFQLAAVAFNTAQLANDKEKAWNHMRAEITALGLESVQSDPLAQLLLKGSWAQALQLLRLLLGVNFCLRKHLCELETFNTQPQIKWAVRLSHFQTIFWIPMWTTTEQVSDCNWSSSVLAQAFEQLFLAPETLNIIGDHPSELYVPQKQFENWWDKVLKSPLRQSNAFLIILIGYIRHSIQKHLIPSLDFLKAVPHALDLLPAEKRLEVLSLIQEMIRRIDYKFQNHEIQTPCWNLSSADKFSMKEWTETLLNSPIPFLKNGGCCLLLSTELTSKEKVAIFSVHKNKTFEEYFGQYCAKLNEVEWIELAEELYEKELLKEPYLPVLRKQEERLPQLQTALEKLQEKDDPSKSGFLLALCNAKIIKEKLHVLESLKNRLLEQVQKPHNKFDPELIGQIFNASQKFQNEKQQIVDKWFQDFLKTLVEMKYDTPFKKELGFSYAIQISLFHERKVLSGALLKILANTAVDHPLLFPSFLLLLIKTSQFPLCLEEAFYVIDIWKTVLAFHSKAIPDKWFESLFQHLFADNTKSEKTHFPLLSLVQLVSAAQLTLPKPLPKRSKGKKVKANQPESISNAKEIKKLLVSAILEWIRCHPDNEKMDEYLFQIYSNRKVCREFVETQEFKNFLVAVFLLILDRKKIDPRLKLDDLLKSCPPTNQNQFQLIINKTTVLLKELKTDNREQREEVLENYYKPVLSFFKDNPMYYSFSIKWNFLDQWTSIALIDFVPAYLEELLTQLKERKNKVSERELKEIFPIVAKIIRQCSKVNNYLFIRSLLESLKMLEAFAIFEEVVKEGKIQIWDTLLKTIESEIAIKKGSFSQDFYVALPYLKSELVSVLVLKNAPEIAVKVTLKRYNRIVKNCLSIKTKELLELDQILVKGATSTIATAFMKSLKNMSNEFYVFLVELTQTCITITKNNLREGNRYNISEESMEGIFMFFEKMAAFDESFQKALGFNEILTQAYWLGISLLEMANSNLRKTLEATFTILENRYAKKKLPREMALIMFLAGSDYQLFQWDCILEAISCLDVRKVQFSPSIRYLFNPGGIFNEGLEILKKGCSEYWKDVFVTKYCEFLCPFFISSCTVAIFSKEPAPPSISAPKTQFLDLLASLSPNVSTGMILVSLVSECQNFILLKIFERRNNVNLLALQEIQKTFFEWYLALMPLLNVSNGLNDWHLCQTVVQKNYQLSLILSLLCEKKRGVETLNSLLYEQNKKLLEASKFSWSQQEINSIMHHALKVSRLKSEKEINLFIEILIDEIKEYIQSEKHVNHVYIELKAVEGRAIE